MALRYFKDKICLSSLAVKDTSSTCLESIPQLEATNPISIEVSLNVSQDVSWVYIDMLPRPRVPFFCLSLNLVTFFSVREAKLKATQVAVNELVGDPTQPHDLLEALFVLKLEFQWPYLVR